jgi:hypothetical protein
VAGKVMDEKGDPSGALEAARYPAGLREDASGVRKQPQRNPSY